MDNRGNITFADEYQDLTKETEIYTSAAELFIDRLTSHLNMPPTDEMEQARDWLCLAYCTGKLNGESGELAEIIFKAFRGNVGVLTEEQKQLAMKELGDILWYVARISDLLGFRLSDVMTANIQKLFDRQDRGVLHGYGDER